LAKDASSALVDLGAALQDVAKPDEITEMVQGTLSKDSNVRNAVLQALQPVDLTELDYSVELWIATHDADEQNANLASHLWEDNGLDIPETYLDGLVRFLGELSLDLCVPIETDNQGMTVLLFVRALPPLSPPRLRSIPRRSSRPLLPVRSCTRRGASS
jgi:hypothetical protein